MTAGKGYAALAKAVSRVTGGAADLSAGRGGDRDLDRDGELFGFSDTWHLVINTGTMIVTILMVFLIQNTQNRDTQAIQIKLDERIRATQGAHNALLDLEELNEAELEAFRLRYERLAALARERRDAGDVDTDTPDA